MKNFALPEGPNALTDTKYGLFLYNKNDTYVGKSIEKYGEYSDFEIELLAQLIPKGALVVEVGANMGAHTVALSKIVGENGLVLAFEPQRRLFELICANAALNQLFNIMPLCRALGAFEGAIVVPNINYSVPNNFGALSLGEWQNGEKVELQTLDSLSLPICALIKIDAQGMEMDAIKGAEETIAKFRPVLYVENDREDKKEALIEYIKTLNYRLFWHLPYMYNPNNYRNDSENIFGEIVSMNMVCFPAEADVNVEGLQEIID